MPTINSEVKYKFGTQSAYDALATKDNNTLYFITDTHRLYLGDTDYTGSISSIGTFGNNSSSVMFGGQIVIPKIVIGSDGRIQSVGNTEITMPTGGTFTSDVTVPAPATAMNPATKQYVDVANAAIMELYNQENSRIDSIIANNADSDGNTELVDIRTNVDGIISESAGSAVRRQVTILTNSIAYLSDDGTIRFSAENFKNNGLDSNGVFNSIHYQVSTKDIIITNTKITLTPNDGFRIYLYYFDSNDNVESTVSWQTSAYTVSSGKRFKFVIARVVQNTGEIANVDEFVNAVRVSTNLSETIELCNSVNDNLLYISNDGTVRFDKTLFVNYGLNDSGVINQNRYRVSNANVTLADRDITITPISGFKCYIHYFDSEDVWQSSSGWQTTSYTISNGSRYKILIARVSENTGEIADVGEFINALKVSTYLTEIDKNVQEFKNNIESVFKDGKTYLDKSLFTNRGLNSYGRLNSVKYRVSHKDIAVATDDIMLIPCTGFRFYTYYFYSTDIDEGVKSTQSWTTSSYTIASGSYYKIVIARTTEDANETANIAEFVSAVKVGTYISELTTRAEIADLYSGYNFKLPEYYNTDNYLYQKINAIHLHERAEDSQVNNYDHNTATYAFITDMHYPANKLSSLPLLERIKNQTNATHLFYGGDSVRALGTAQNLIDDNYNIATLLYQVYGNDYSYIFGNHDYIISTGSKWGEGMVTVAGVHGNGVYAIYKKGFSSDSHVEGTNHHYWDDSANKIRHIFIDYMNAEEPSFLQWFGMVALDAPDGYGLCFYAHTPFIQATQATGAKYPPEAPSDGMSVLADWICAVANKSTFGTYDYRDTNLYVIYGAFGHIHQDSITTYNNVNFFSATCDAMYSDDGYDRQAGTITENAFDVITINKNTKTVYLTRIGAGIDRSFTYI